MKLIVLILPNPQEATFAAEPEIVEESSPAETPEHGPAPDIDRIKNCYGKPKKEFKVNPEILFPDFAWEKYMVEPSDYLIKIAKKNMVIFAYGGISIPGIKMKLVITLISFIPIIFLTCKKNAFPHKQLNPLLLNIKYKPVTISGILPEINTEMPNPGSFSFGIMKKLLRPMSVY